MKPVARPRGTRLIVSTGALVLTALLAATALAQTGNQKAISFYRKSMSAMGAEGQLTFTGGGMRYKIIHKPGYDTFEYYLGAPLPGYSLARAKVVIEQRSGSVSEEVDVLSAKGLPDVEVWHNPKIVIGKVLDKRGCAGVFSSSGNSYTPTVGGPFVVFESGSRFGALKKKGQDDVVPSSYPIGGGTAKENDTIASSSKLWVKSFTHVTSGQYKGAFVSEKGFRYNQKTRYIQPPQLGKC